MLPPNLFLFLSDPPNRPWTPGARAAPPEPEEPEAERPSHRIGAVLLMLLAMPLGTLRPPQL